MSPFNLIENVSAKKIVFVLRKEEEGKSWERSAKLESGSRTNERRELNKNIGETFGGGGLRRAKGKKLGL